MVDRLLDAGFRQVTVLDVSEIALDRSRRRLGDRAGIVDWLVSDVTQAEFTDPFDVWHDRAVFHFLTSAEDRSSYIERMRGALTVGGTAVIATFGPEGPTRCSGLPVIRYAAEELGEELGPGFTLVHASTVDHTTPGGITQQFVYTAFTRV